MEEELIMSLTTWLCKVLGCYRRFQGWGRYGLTLAAYGFEIKSHISSSSGEMLWRWLGNLHYCLFWSSSPLTICSTYVLLLQQFYPSFYTSSTSETLLLGLRRTSENIQNSFKRFSTIHVGTRRLKRNAILNGKQDCRSYPLQSLSNGS